MARKNPVFSYKGCMACLVCVDACPVSCIASTKLGLDANKTAYPEIAAAEKCIGCGICAKACPLGAIAMVGESA